MVAEEQGFEPWEDFHPRRFSRPVHSTTLPLLRHALPRTSELILQTHFFNLNTWTLWGFLPIHTRDAFQMGFVRLEYTQDPR